MVVPPIFLLMKAQRHREPRCSKMGRNAAWRTTVPADGWNQASAPRTFTFCPGEPIGRDLCLL